MTIQIRIVERFRIPRGGCPPRGCPCLPVAAFAGGQENFRGSAADSLVVHVQVFNPDLGSVRLPLTLLAQAKDVVRLAPAEGGRWRTRSEAGSRQKNKSPLGDDGDGFCQNCC
jgi:hypothetical protein